MDLLTVNMDSASIAAADPIGEMRRNGFTGKAVPVATSSDGKGSEWTHKTVNTSFRVCEQRNRLYKRESGPLYFGGYRIMYVPLVGRGLQVAREWLS
jgi:hypothetical protein